MANVKISALTAGTALSGSEQIEAVQGGSSVRITASQMKDYATQEAITYRAVANAFSETFAAGQDIMVLYNAGNLGSGTVIMPATPLNGQVNHITFAMGVTNLTVSPNAGQSIVGAPTTASATTPYAFVYRSANATWYRMV